MHARVVHVLRHRHFGFFKSGVGSGLVARVPSEDVVMVLTLAVGAFGLAGQVVADDRCARLQRGVGVHHHGQFFVFHFYGFYGVSRDVAVVCDDDGYFLHLEVNLFVGQHGGHITSEGGHPVKLQRLQVVGGQHRVHTRDGQGGFLVDFDDAAVGDGATHDVHVQHAGHLDVIDIIAFALDETGVFFAQARGAHASQREFAGFYSQYRCVHVCLRSNRGVLQAATGSCNFLAAYWTALMMFW